MRGSTGARWPPGFVHENGLWHNFFRGGPEFLASPPDPRVSMPLPVRPGSGPLGVSTLLDHGCGRGADVAHYRSAGLDADGYDPYADAGGTTW